MKCVYLVVYTLNVYWQVSSTRNYQTFRMLGPM
jgi:hypothetical protein